MARIYEPCRCRHLPTYYRANTAEDLRQLAAAHGLELIALQAIADPTYLAFTPALFRLMIWF
ncbi:MAG: hypothetical protein IPG51_13000 [Chloroflexi bacterium]|nr:hypothetical protein [Chloroflexota bacterium]